MKQILPVVFLLVTKLVTGQNNAGMDTTKLPDNKFSLTISPLSLVDPYSGNMVRIGAGCKLYRNISFSLDYGKYFELSGIGMFSSFLMNTTGYMIRPEIKLYLNSRGKTSGEYLAIEYFYKKIKFDYNDSILIQPNPAYLKDYTVLKNISCINLKFGTTDIYKKRFILEYFIGAGIRFTNGYTTLTKEESEHVIKGEDSWHGGDIRGFERTINHILPNVTLGVKIGYCLKK